eukprot:TRINITY_DN10335_c0_g1_i2.p1 TRINITY_DN10335_c0_g1~~TRINITY_DN10335_c0_g1_i2.p1  ORF type:complete len:419 (+),score=92.18 TRINITY_DN10335_c0_g1_i2:28-1284(+)
MSYEDYDSEVSSCSDTRLFAGGLCGADDEAIEKDLDNVDEEGTQSANVRKTYELANFFGTLSSLGLCDRVEINGDDDRFMFVNNPTSPDSLHHYLVQDVPSTLLGNKSFLVMDTEVLSVGSKKAKNQIFVPLEIAFSAITQTSTTYAVRPVYHTPINPGTVSGRVLSQKDDEGWLLTYHYGVKHLHAMGASSHFESGYNVPRGARSDFLTIWKELEDLVAKHSNVIVVKGGQAERQSLAWLLHMAKKQAPDPSHLPDNVPFMLVDANNCAELRQHVVDPLWYPTGSPTTYDDPALLPFSDYFMSYSAWDQKPTFGEWSFSARCYSDMNSELNFSGGVERYLNEYTLRHVLALHEARIWTSDSEACDFHSEVQPIHEEFWYTANNEDIPEDKGRPFHLHCCKKDTTALANGLVAVLSMK